LHRLSEGICESERLRSATGAIGPWLIRERMAVARWSASHCSGPISAPKNNFIFRLRACNAALLFTTLKRAQLNNSTQLTTTMKTLTAQDIAPALESIGYDLTDIPAYRVEPGRIVIAIADNDGDDSEDTLADLRKNLP